MGKFDDLSFYGRENEELQKEYERMFCNMTQEEEQLLLKDLCARLPYGPKVHIVGDWFYDYMEPYDSTLDKVFFNLLTPRNPNLVVKAYLRPMSSMTEEEINEFILISETVLWLGNKRSTCILSLEQMDWLSAHHFDYRGLIEKGLALEAPNDMYK